MIHLGSIVRFTRHLDHQIGRMAEVGDLGVVTHVFKPNKIFLERQLNVLLVGEGLTLLVPETYVRELDGDELSYVLRMPLSPPAPRAS